VRAGLTERAGGTSPEILRLFPNDAIRTRPEVGMREAQCTDP
jgi:hypothetical protein